MFFCEHKCTILIVDDYTKALTSQACVKLSTGCVLSVLPQMGELVDVRFLLVDNR